MTTKRLLISHSTHYRFDRPVTYALQRLKLRPKDSAGQMVVDWNIDIEGGRIQSACEDAHLNHVALVSVDSGRTEVLIKCSGAIETTNSDGIIGKHRGNIPLWCFLKPTKLTTAGKAVAKMLGGIKIDPANELGGLHTLSDIIRDHLPYKDGYTNANTTAEQAIGIGKGVCQDHAHIFLAAARGLGIPSRYVSGYLLMDGVIDQSASHAWVEAHIEPLGWVGFDVSNGYSPDQRYIRVATGFDYSDAAPISGLSFGALDESMVVSLRVEQ
ncbi:MAG: transglutaminase family protein [Sphingorhabdus sp.]